MYIVNGIAYAGEREQEPSVREVKPLDDLMMIVTFDSGEKRLYDATQLLAYPAFQPLRDERIFKKANGKISALASVPLAIFQDVATQTMISFIEGKISL